jgi:hypothetical protein
MNNIYARYTQGICQSRLLQQIMSNLFYDSETAVMNGRRPDRRQV